MYHYHVTPYSTFTNCPINVLYSNKIRFRVTRCILFSCSLVSFDLKYFLSIFLFLMILIHLKITGQLFCRLCLNLGLSDLSSWLDLRYTSFGKNIQEVMLGIFSLPFYKVAHSSNLTITDNINVDSLIKVVIARLLHCKVTLFSFLIILCGDTLCDYTNIPFLITDFVHLYNYQFMESYFIQWVTICTCHYLFWYLNCPSLASWSLLRAGFCALLTCPLHPSNTSLFCHLRMLQVHLSCSSYGIHHLSKESCFLCMISLLETGRGRLLFHLFDLPNSGQSVDESPK